MQILKSLYLALVFFQQQLGQKVFSLEDAIAEIDKYCAEF
jgi:hypothetical protein